MFPLSLDTVTQIGELILAAPVAWKFNRAINRLMDVMKDFPPHRHVNGKIVFPGGYQPPVVERLETAHDA